MDITPQDAFKLGFLARCAEEKLTGAALEARLQKVAEFNKTAAEPWIKWAPITQNSLVGGVGSVASTGLDLLKAIYAVPPAAAILGGGAAGYGLAKAVEPTINDDEVKAQEIADTYKLYTEKAKARKKMRQYRNGGSRL